MSEMHEATAAGGFGYFEHDADIGVIGYGGTIEAAFERAAEAMFAVMIDLASVKPSVPVAVSFDEDDPELALVTWLNQLLATARVERLALTSFQLRRSGTRWHGTARGEPWRQSIERGVEVKGATLTMLSVRQDDSGWQARCVVDV